ncbi:type I-E CRISPR-associated protein Cse2/CasB [Streptomyces sp. NPDC051963]|uniref:type I-E CRISPR-associated protein Cse2/CasB n=1 Tax=Streptomyces sp. NPDC051963 TaxID=3365678 RepID=UPI0037D79D7A
MPTLTTAQRRAHYDAFVADIIDLCTVGGVRSALASGRGRPVEECDRMKPYLVARISGFGARQAHYTVASLIAAHRHLRDDDEPYTPESAVPASGNTLEADSRDEDPPGAGPTDRALDTPGQGDRPAENPVRPYDGRAWRARPNLGTTLAIAVARHGFKQGRMDDRIKTLTRLPATRLHPRLWTLTAHLSSLDAARLDFAVLLEDLAWWDTDRLYIADRWTESYFLTLDRLVSQEN